MFHYVRVNPAAIVADQNFQLVGSIFQLNLDVAGPGMAKCVEHRLPADTVNVIANAGL